MRKIIQTAIPLFLFSGLVLAEGSDHDSCKDVSMAAKGIMEARQANVLLTDMIEISDRQEDEAVRKLTKRLTLAAYKRPLYNSGRFKEKAVREFANKAYLDCAK